MRALREPNRDPENELRRIEAAETLYSQLKAADCDFCRARRRSLYERAAVLARPSFWPKHAKFTLDLAMMSDDEIEVYLQLLECDAT